MEREGGEGWGGRRGMEREGGEGWGGRDEKDG